MADISKHDRQMKAWSRSCFHLYVDEKDTLYIILVFVHSSDVAHIINSCTRSNKRQILYSYKQQMIVSSLQDLNTFIPDAGPCPLSVKMWSVKQLIYSHVQMLFCWTVLPGPLWSNSQWFELWLRATTCHLMGESYTGEVLTNLCMSLDVAYASLENY